MTKEKHNKSRRAKPHIVALCILLVLCLAAGGTLAYMFSKADVDNQFDLAEVTCQVNYKETLSGKQFDVTNTDEIDAYIRVAIVVNWMDAAGNVRGIAPASSDYDLLVYDTDWLKDPNTGYYYHIKPVVAGGTTKLLIEGITQNVAAPSGYKLSVEVVAEAIQADGTTDGNNPVPAVTDAWGVNVDSNKYLTLN